MTPHYTARPGVGLPTVIACGDSREQVIREALRLERHPAILEVPIGGTCGRCGFTREWKGAGNG